MVKKTNIPKYKHPKTDQDAKKLETLGYVFSRHQFFSDEPPRFVLVGYFPKH